MKNTKPCASVVKATRLLLVASFCVLFSTATHAEPYGHQIVTSGQAKDFSSGTFANISSSASPGGAAIYNNGGYVTGTDVLFRSNAITDYRAGAIYNTGTIMLVTSTFINNRATSKQAGAIYNGANALFTGTNLVFISNTASTGGAITNASGTLILVSGTFIGNTTASSAGGGAILGTTGGYIRGTDLVFITNTSTASSSVQGGAISIHAGEMVLVSSTFISNRTRSSSLAYGGAIYNTATFTGTGLVFISNTAQRGGAYYATSSALVDSIASSTFSENYSTVYGGAIYTERGIAGSDLIFENNSAGNNGGAIHFNASSYSSTLISSTFTGNMTTNRGGAISVGGELIGTDLLFQRNTASNYGGSIYFTGRVILDTTAFTGNHASLGGAVMAWGGIFTGTNLLFQSNTASSTGGAFYNYNTVSAILVSTTFIGNYANDAGAFINVTTFTGTDLLFQSNTASSTSGAVYNSRTTAITSATFVANYAGNAGGALVNNTSATFTGTDITFDGNASGAYGGAIYNDGAIVTGTNFVFISNTAADVGGAIFNVASGVIDIVSGTFENNYSGTLGGAIYSAEDAPLTLDVSAMSMVGNRTSGTGGAIYSGTNFSLAVADAGVFTATTNKAFDDDSGGFLYIASGSMIFDIGAGATATIGDATSIADHTDSISAADNTISLTKSGAGVLTLWANNTYTGTTFINAGLLDLRGHISSTHAIVANSSTLAGTGTAGGHVTIQGGGHLSPGASPGQFTILGDLTFENNAQFDVELGAKTNPGHIDQTGTNDRVIVEGDVILSGTSHVNVTFSAPVEKGEYDLIKYTGNLLPDATGTMTLGTVIDNSGTLVADTSPYSVVTSDTKWIKLMYDLGESGYTYWDGGAGGNWTDNAVSGGSGTWFAPGINAAYTAWTGSESGSPNGEWLDGAFAIFTTASGTVTVENSGTDININGMQFTVDGYLMTGGTLTTSGTDANIQIRVDLTHSTTIATEITGTHGLEKTGAGKLILSGSNTYEGDTLISNGRLAVDGYLGGTATTLTATATTTLSGSGVIGGAVTMQAGSTLSPDGKLTIGNNLTLNPGSTVVFDLAATETWGDGNDWIDVGGDLKIEASSTLAIASVTTPGAGLYHLVSYTGALSFDNLALDYGTTGLSADNTYVQIAVANEVNLVTTGTDDRHADPTRGTEFIHWDAGVLNDGTVSGGSGAWHAWLVANGTAVTPENWATSDGSANAMWQTAGHAIFGGDAPGTVTLSNAQGDITASGLTFNTDGYLLQGSALRLTSTNATLNVASGVSATLAMTVTANNVTKAGAGAIHLDNTTTHTGTTTIAAGELYANATLTTAELVATAGLLGGRGAIIATNGVTIATATLAPTGTLNITGDLNLAADSVSAFDLGSLGNDLVNITGALTLGGTLNVAANGAFVTGEYRLFNYTTGQLTDNTLTIGAMPAGTNTGENYFIQTGKPAEVNLVYIADADTGSVNYWDGARANYTAVEGGSGTWQAWASGRDNWTTATGTLNAPWQSHSHAMFTTTGGTVTVSAAAGEVTLKGATFTVSDYRIQGDRLFLGGTTSALLDAQTGTTTIASVLTGSSGVGLAKEGAGTLILSASNTYTGTTGVLAGTLRLADLGATGTGGVTVAAPATLDLAGAGAYANAIDGSGTALVSGNGVNITGTNAIAAWNITGSGTVSGTHNLGSGSTRIEGVLAIDSASAWIHTNALAGAGLLSVDTDSSTLDFATSAGAAFTGTVALRNTTLSLSSSNNAALLANATLQVSTGGTLFADNTAQQTLGGLDMAAGGAVAIEMNGMVPTTVLDTGTLAVDNTAKIILANYTGTNPIVSTTNAKNFLDEDGPTTNATLLIATDNLLTNPRQVAIHNADGDRIGAEQDIEYDAVIATYGFAGVMSGSAYTATSATAGLYYDYVLTQLDVKTGTTLVLDTTGATDTTLVASITGTGNVTFSATGGSITLGGTNTYYGATLVTSGTLIAGTDNALGNTRRLDIETDGALDLNGHTQSVGAGGAQIDGGLFGSGSLGLGGLATITSTNATFSANVGVGGTTVLTSPESLGKEGVVTIADTALLRLDTATGTLAKTISGTGNVELVGSEIEVAGANGAFSGTFLIGDGSKLAASTDANLGDANLSGEGVFEKITETTAITIGHANTFTGTTLVTGGTLRLENLRGLGASAVINDAILDLAATGTFANNIAGTGTTAVTGAGVNLTGTNSTAWNITGSGTVSTTANLGLGNTHIDGELSIAATTAWAYSNTLTGTGTLAVNLSGNAFSFSSSAFSPSAFFEGTLELHSAAFDLSGDNTLALTNATLQIDTDAHVTVGDGAQQIGNLTLASGTIGFTLAGSGTGVLGTIKTNVLDVQNTVIVVDTSLGNSLPLLQQDETQSIRLIESATLAAGSGTMLNVHDETGNVISDASVSDIIQGAEIVAEGAYDYKALATNSGLTLDYMLEALVLRDGKTTTLTGDIADSILAGADELHATVSGDGSLRIAADDTIYLNGANTYTGTTTVTAGTLVAGVDGALGATARLYVTGTATFDLNNTAQTIRDGGAIDGTITGSGALTLTGGTLTIASANTGYTAQTNINGLATVVIEDAAGLGSSIVALAGVLEVSNAAPGTLTATLAGSGTLVKSDAGALTIAGANALTGHVDITDGRIIATTNDALGIADIDVDAGAVFEQNGFAGTLQNNLSGAGAHTLAAAHITIDDPAKYRVASTTLDGASTLTLAAGNITIGALSLNSGTLAFAAAVPIASGTICSLKGSAGSIVMNANMALLTSSDTIYNGGEVANHLVIGSAGGLAHTVRINAANNLDARNIAIALIDVDAASTATFALDVGKLEYDMTALELVRGDGSVYTPETNTWYLSDRSLSHAADAIIQTAATLALDWAYSLDALHLRMGEIRTENLSPSDNPKSAIQNPKSGNLWLRARGYRLNAGSELTGYGFEQYGWGATAGADKAFDAETGVNLLGAFIDMGTVDRKFDNSGTGKTHSVGLGAYGTILKNNGWFMDAVARFDRYSNEFDAKSYDGKITRGSYTTKGVSLSVEAGRRFQHAGGWWLEPGVQAAVLWLNGASYATEATAGQRAIKVKVSDSDTWQYRALARFGRQFMASRWYPYGKVAAVAVDGNGGSIRAHGKSYRADYDGKRVEFGFGTMYRINDISQLYLDYEYARSSAYERPWSINAGYRKLW